MSDVIIDQINKSIANLNESHRILSEAQLETGKAVYKLGKAYKISMYIMACNIVCLIVILGVLLVKL